MKYRIESRLNDGMAEAPPVEVEAADADELLRHIYEEYLDSDSTSVAMPPVGSTVTVERVA